VVAVERDAVLLVAKTSTATATAIGAMVAATHALHIHMVLSILVRCWRGWEIATLPCPQCPWLNNS
jgi:hypothetical protein